MVGFSFYCLCFLTFTFRSQAQLQKYNQVSPSFWLCALTLGYAVRIFRTIDTEYVMFHVKWCKLLKGSATHDYIIYNKTVWLHVCCIVFWVEPWGAEHWRTYLVNKLTIACPERWRKGVGSMHCVWRKCLEPVNYDHTHLSNKGYQVMSFPQHRLLMLYYCLVNAAVDVTIWASLFYTSDTLIWLNHIYIYILYCTCIKGPVVHVSYCSST